MMSKYPAGNLKWAVAGRNQSKLDAVRANRDISVLTADAHNTESLHELVKKTRVVLTTFARYGSELVAACVEHDTHYCDLTGEVHWMKEMIHRYQDAAVASGARIVHTCGFDSIPSDVGVYFLQIHMLERHGEPARHIKYRVSAFKGGFSGGTIDSMMAMMEAAKTDPSIMTTITDP